MRKSAAVALQHSDTEGGITSELSSTPDDLDERIAGIERMVREIYSALFAREPSPTGKVKRKNLLPYNPAQYEAALIEARGGNYKALQQYLKKYQPRPGAA